MLIWKMQWAIDSVEELTQMGVLEGTGENRFMPNRMVTREEFIKMLVVSFNILMNLQNVIL